MNCPLTQQPCSQPKLFHITEIHGKKIVAFDLCDQCIAQYVQDGTVCAQPEEETMSEMVKNIAELFAFVMGDLQPKANKNLKTCPNCKSTWEDILKTQKIGCSQCYEYFGQPLKMMLSNIQGGTQHVGKAPKAWKQKQETKNKIEILQKKMNKAIKEERYEEASKLRDELKNLNADVPPTAGDQ
jgi:protein arginine kinase activator